ncbi:MAG: CvpA family protein [Chitinophagaceae bacterium]|nr:CvpA family protein [Chitinophagaceae bacterium]
MIIDVLYGITLSLAVWKGLRLGLMIGVFSLLAVIIALAAALKLSAIAAFHLSAHFPVPKDWVPFLSFLIVFIGFIWLIRMGAGFLEKTAEAMSLGWLNKAGGAFLFVIIYTLIFSVLLFYAQKMKVINQTNIDASVTYDYVQPWGPMVINRFGDIVPVFQDIFQDLELFFEKLAQELKPEN